MKKVDALKQKESIAAAVSWRIDCTRGAGRPDGPAHAHGAGGAADAGCARLAAGTAAAVFVAGDVAVGADRRAGRHLAGDTGVTG